MTSLDLITEEDLDHFKTELFAELRNLGISFTPEEAGKKWFKSAEVRKLLKISAGTLQNLRINGTIAHSKVGSLLYYNQEDITRLLEGNTSKR